MNLAEAAARIIGSSAPDIAEIAARTYRDYTGHFAGKPTSSRAQAEVSGRKPGIAQRLVEAGSRPPLYLRQLVDDVGIPVLYTSGVNHNHRACACISFPGQRWLRFLSAEPEERMPS